MSATTIARDISSLNKKGNMNSTGFATVNPSNGEEIETFSGAWRVGRAAITALGHQAQSSRES
jgi:hypothetical protein